MNPAPALSTETLLPPAVAGVEKSWDSTATVKVGMWLAIAAISMLFLAFTSAYIVRLGMDPEWQSLRMPRLLPANTVLLLLTSVCLEVARGARKPKPWLFVTFGGGLLFVAGQLAIWRQLGWSGQVFAASAHASFFYTLTAVHGAHLAGGIVALGWIASVRVLRRHWLDGAALYWHFMGVLWLYLVFLLFGVR
jgi:cytochrome c oxidase subunit 3